MRALATPEPRRTPALKHKRNRERVEGLGFKVSGFIGFRVLGFGVSGLGFGAAKPSKGRVFVASPVRLG